MATFYACKAQLIIAGSNIQQGFNVGEGSLIGITLHDDFVVTPVRALNYTPNAISVLTQTIDVSIGFLYTYTNNDTLFDFSALPYQLLNIQASLLSFTNETIALIGQLYYKSSNIQYSRPGVPVTRTIMLGGLTINYPPGNF